MWYASKEYRHRSLRVFFPQGFKDRYQQTPNQGVGAEMIAEQWGFSRTDLDQFRAAVANGFGQRGAHMGSTDPEQPALFRADMLAFHAATFA